MAVNTDRILALLAAADAQIRTRIDAHGATWEVYDALPGDEHGRDGTHWKSGRIKGLEWACYRPHSPRPAEDDPADGA